MLWRRQLMMRAGGLAASVVLGRANRANAAEFERFSVLLPVPPLIDARQQGNSVRIAAREGRRAFFPGMPAKTYGYSSDYLAPAIRVHRGDTVQIEVENRINRPTTAHWHGLLVPASVDGARGASLGRARPGGRSLRSISRKPPLGFMRTRTTTRHVRSTWGLRVSS